MKCAEPGCDRPTRTRGYCSTHYSKHHSAGTLKIHAMKACEVCVKPFVSNHSHRTECDSCLSVSRIDAFFWQPGELERSVKRCVDAMNEGVIMEDLMERFGHEVFSIAKKMVGPRTGTLSHSRSCMPTL